MPENKLFRKLILTISLFSLALTMTAFDVAAQCDGTFFKRTTGRVLPGVDANFYLTEDMTGDAKPDLVGFARDPELAGNFKVIILPADGVGGFGAPTFISGPSGIYLTSFIVGDFDGNTYRDIALVTGTGPRYLQVYKNNGDGSYTPQSSHSLFISTPYFLGDLNGDGKGDLIVFYNQSSEYHLSFGNGDGTFGQSAPFFQGSGHLIPADFTGDGKTDFFAGTNLFINMGGGVFNTTASGISFSIYENIRHIRDFTGDGKLDILTQTVIMPTIKVALLVNNGDNTFTRSEYVIADNQTEPNWYGQVHVGNFSGGGALDFIYRVDEWGVDKTLVFTNNGSGAFTRQDYDYELKGRFEGDFDGDGKTDFANGTISSIFKESVAVVRKNVCARPGQTEIADFDRDERTNFSFWNPSNGNWSYRTVDAPMTFNWGLGSLGDIPMPGDYDKDGITDFAVYRAGTGVWYVRQSSNWHWYTRQWGVAGDVPAAQDYDGDGFTDMAVFRPSEGNWYVWRMGAQNYTITHFGSEGDRPVPEDYDGDGKADLAVFRPSTGVWYYLKSSDGNSAAIRWGLSTDKPVPADYDGDNKADISVYRASEGIWYILRSSDSSYAAFRFGVAEDRPQPGDYDGDGIFDAGVFRPSTNVWYTTASADQTLFGDRGAVPTASILRVE